MILGNSSYSGSGNRHTKIIFKMQTVIITLVNTKK